MMFVKSLPFYAPARVRSTASRPVSTQYGPIRQSVKEHEAGFELQLVVPGYAKEALKLEVAEGVLTVSADIAETKESGTYRTREFAPRSFSRRYRLSDQVDATAIAANYEAGILTISLPKVAKPEPALIPVH